MYSPYDASYAICRRNVLPCEEATLRLRTFFPDEASCIHGSNDKLIFAQIHDLFHTDARASRKFVQEEMMSIAEKIQVNPENRKQYESKLDGKQKEYPAFNKKPTEQELLAFLLDRIKGEVVDGGYTFTKPCSLNLLKIAKGVIQYEYDKQLSYLTSFPQQDISEKIQTSLNNNCI